MVAKVESQWEKFGRVYHFQGIKKRNEFQLLKLNHSLQRIISINGVIQSGETSAFEIGKTNKKQKNNKTERKNEGLL